MQAQNLKFLQQGFPCRKSMACISGMATKPREPVIQLIPRLCYLPLRAKTGHNFFFHSQYAFPYTASIADS